MARGQQKLGQVFIFDMNLRNVLLLLSHTADEESSEQPEGSLLNLALATGSENSSSTVTTVVQGPDGHFFIPVPGNNLVT